MKPEVQREGANNTSTWWREEPSATAQQNQNPSHYDLLMSIMLDLDRLRVKESIKQCEPFNLHRGKKDSGVCTIKDSLPSSDTAEQQNRASDQHKREQEEMENIFYRRHRFRPEPESKRMLGLLSRQQDSHQITCFHY